MTIPTRHHTIEVYELSPDCLQVQPVQASSTEQDTNVTSLFATEHEQHQHQQVTTVSETEAEHLAQALAITEAAILVYDTGDEASLGYLRSLAGLLDRAVELHQHQHRQQIPTSQQHQHQLRKKTKEKKTSPSDSKPAPSNEPRNSGTARRSAWPSLKRVSSAETKAEETNSSKEERPALPVSPLPPLTPSSPDQGLDQDQIRRSAQEEEEQKYHFLLLGVKPDGPPVDPERSHNQQNRTTTTPHSRGYQRTSTWSAPSVEFLEIASSSRSEWNMALDILGDKVLGSRRSRGARSCRYRRDCQDGNGQSGVMVEEDTNTVSAQDGGTKGLSQDQGHQHQNQGQGAKKHPQTQSKMQRHEAGKDHTQTQPAFESLESMALTLFSAPSSKLSNTSRHLRFNPHHHHHHHQQQQQNKSTLARSSRWGLLRSVLSVGSVLRADVKRKTAQRQLAAGERK